MEPFADTQLRAQLAALLEQQAELNGQFGKVLEALSSVQDAQGEMLLRALAQLDAIAAQVGVPAEVTE